MSTLEALEELKTKLSALKNDLAAIELPEIKPPSIPDVAGTAADAVMMVMQKGSTKSAYGEWFTRDSLRYNADRCIKHVTIAMQQIDGNVPSPDTNGETAEDHLCRALTRAAFLLVKTKKGKTQ